MRKLIRRGAKLTGYLFLSTLLFILTSNLWVIYKSSPAIYDYTADIPKADVGLVLGTSKYSASGTTNLYFKHRMEAAANLYKTGVVQHLLVSGDNETRYYNEPRDMLEALIKLGVPEEAITLDYAGFRTLDSVVRCKKVFGQEDVIIITQQFHSYRAVFIGQHYNMSARAYIAGGVKGSTQVNLREILARPKAVIDLYLLGKDPRYLGDKIELNL